MKSKESSKSKRGKRKRGSRLTRKKLRDLPESWRKLNKKENRLPKKLKIDLLGQRVMRSKESN